ncbi:hypothetical protein UY3_15553 [Chelonia mydas]|uniref:Uncharacterized protein n=1 Tax=Chelonia mydas TaxID=8469 RepID=M7ARY7_CHEMY|nr:hypothetical protein UY3_15553 [Chelonia mydas]
MVDILSPEGPSKIVLLLIKTIQSNYKTIWQTPSSSAPTAKGVKRKYFAPSKGYEFLFCHPSPCSLVVSAVNEKEHHGQQAPAPKAKEAKRLDLFGRKVYSSRGLQLRIANQQAILNRHNFNSWAAVGKFKDNLPQGSQQEFTALADEGKAVAKTSLQAFLDSADAAARTIASGVVMRHSALLQESGLPPEVQSTLQDLPFEGSGLFSDQTDARLHSLKDSRATLKSLVFSVTQIFVFKLYSINVHIIDGIGPGASAGLALQFLPPQAVKKTAAADGKREKLLPIFHCGRPKGEAGAITCPPGRAEKRCFCRIPAAAEKRPPLSNCRPKHLLGTLVPGAGPGLLISG